MTTLKEREPKTNPNLVRIRKLNEAKVVVTAFDEIKNKISKEFKFRSENYFFDPLVKSGKWDGFIRLYDLRNKTLPTGLVPRLLKLLDTLDCDIKIEDDIAPTMFGSGLKPDDYFSLKDAEKIFRGLKLPGYELRKDQMRALVHAIQYERAILKCPTNFGKSILIYMIVRYFLNKTRISEGQYPPMCIAIICPDAGLIEQMYSDFEEYSIGTDPKVFDPSKHIHRIHSGMEKVKSVLVKSTQRPVIISTWQSLHNIEDPSYFDSFGLVIGDEAHDFAAKSLKTLMFERFKKAFFRIGVTGTIDEEPSRRALVEGCFGPLKVISTSQKMIEQGESSKIEIKCIQLKYSKKELKALYSATNKLSYANEIKYICNHRSRNQLISNYLETLEGNALIIFKLVENHGKPLTRLLTKNFLGRRKIFYIDRFTPIEEREKIKEYIETHDDAFLLASIKLFSKGQNIKNLQHGILGAPIKKDIPVTQIIGRLLRKDGKKNECFLHDFVDDMRYEDRINYAYRHGNKRKLNYKREQFPYTETKVSIGE